MGSNAAVGLASPRPPWPRGPRLSFATPRSAIAAAVADGNPDVRRRSVNNFALVGNAHATTWTSAKFPGEQDRAVQGCADDAQNPGDWFCIFVRCEQPRSPLTLHFSTPGPDIHGDIKLVIDDDTFAVSVPTSLKSALPLSTRAQALPDALIEAMKAGSAISVQGSHLQSPYNRISLQNSRKAIERIEWACARPYPSAARFWRRLTRSLPFF